jgi:hypothetical protein
MSELGEGLRGRQKEKVLKLWSELNMEVELYFTTWYKYGGGTTGHAIGSAYYRLKKYQKFFKSYC